MYRSAKVSGWRRLKILKVQVIDAFDSPLAWPADDFAFGVRAAAR